MKEIDIGYSVLFERDRFRGGIMLLNELLAEFHEKIANLDGSVTRDQNFPRIPNKIKAVIGMRRTGKTYFLLQYIKSLTKDTIPLSRILYLNFEDDRLLPCSQQKLRELLDDFYALYPENHDHLCYLFLDEIQNVEEWAIVIRRYYDTRKVQIYLTGSSAKLLSKEIATSLRGRSISIEIWPYSFTEYLAAHKVSVDTKVIGKKIHDQSMKHFHQYLNCGGFPETIFLEDSDRIRILQDYVDVVIFRDIIERHKINNIILIKYIIKTLLKNIGSGFSVNKFFNDLKSQGFSVGKMTIHDYLSYIEDAYLAFTLPLYSESIRQTQTNPKKIYAVDTGLVNAYSTSVSKNSGHLFENLVYLDLRRQNHEVFYYLTRSRYEVDFLSRSLDGNLHLYQVVWDINDPDTMQREMRALEEAEKELGIKGKLITPQVYIQGKVFDGDKS